MIWVLSSGIGTSPSASTWQCNNGATSSRTSPLSSGAAAPNFVLPESNGIDVSLSDYLGKVVVLEFFAPWCAHCQDDAPIMNQIAQTYKNQGVEVLGVSATPYGRNYQNGDTSPITIDDIKWFRDSFGVQFPLLFDKDVSLGPAYGVRYFPFVYVVDPQGKIVGQADNPVSVESIKPLIDKAKAAAPTTAQGGSPS